MKNIKTVFTFVSIAFVLFLFSPLDFQGGQVIYAKPKIELRSDFDSNATIATPEKRIIAKDSILKIYFQVSGYSSLEYATYIVKEDNQNESGVPIETSVRGAYTSDIEASFIGYDLTEDAYEKGDVIVLNMRATDTEGNIDTEQVRVLIGDDDNSISELSDEYMPSSVLNPF